MHKFHGELLIGGMRLRDLEGELEDRGDSGTPSFAGRFTIDPAQRAWLALNRPYRLQLDDGRAGQVVLSKMDVPDGEMTMLVEFSGISKLG